MDLVEIVKNKDLKELENYCLHFKKYEIVIENAEDLGVDIEELQELLHKI